MGSPDLKLKLYFWFYEQLKFSPSNQFVSPRSSWRLIQKMQIYHYNYLRRITLGLQATETVNSFLVFEGKTLVDNLENRKFNFYKRLGHFMKSLVNL